MSQMTTRSHQRPSSFRSWSTFFTTKASKPRSDAPQTLLIPARASGSEGEMSPVSSSRSSVPAFVGKSDVRPEEPPSYTHDTSRNKPTTYRFVQESPFSMSLVKREGPSDTAYNISIGLNVWMPSEHITLVRRNADPDGPVLARLE